jgi:PadR family transcriptional regulator PadR
MYSSERKTLIRGDILNIQYKKGVMELCVLSALMQRDMYGYELSIFISKEMDISDGTVYPILRKLKSEGFVTTYLSEDSGGPPRKYYSITTSGKQKFGNESQQWLSFTMKISKLIKGDSDHE